MCAIISFSYLNLHDFSMFCFVPYFFIIELFIVCGCFVKSDRLINTVPPE
jgi:hypothetical protein